MIAFAFTLLLAADPAAIDENRPVFIPDSNADGLYHSTVFDCDVPRTDGRVVLLSEVGDLKAHDLCSAPPKPRNAGRSPRPRPTPMAVDTPATLPTQAAPAPAPDLASAAASQEGDCIKRVFGFCLGGPVSALPPKPDWQKGYTRRPEPSGSLLRRPPARELAGRNVPVTGSARGALLRRIPTCGDTARIRKATP